LNVQNEFSLIFSTFVCLQVWYNHCGKSKGVI